MCSFVARVVGNGVEAKNPGSFLRGDELEIREETDPSCKYSILLFPMN